MKEKRAIIIVFEGIDQSGKETQAERLASRLKTMGKKVHLAGFPDYQTPIGREIGKFLQGERDFNPYARQLLYAANRYEKLDEIQSLLRDMDFLIIDRYTPSGLAYGLVNGLDLDWCLEVERGLPPADCVLLFDVPVEESYQRKQQNRDVYERNLRFLDQVRNAYLDLAGRFGWKVFSSMTTIEDLENQVWQYISQRYSLQGPSF